LLVARVDTDTLIVYDRRLRRVSIFDRDHHIETTLSTVPNAKAIAAVGDRLLMGRSGPLVFGIEGADPNPRGIEYMLVDRISGEVRDVGQFDGERRFGRTDNNGQHGYTLIPFHDRMPSAAPGPHGITILADQGRELECTLRKGNCGRW
jgi:hypothetical protein